MDTSSLLTKETRISAFMDLLDEVFSRYEKCKSEELSSLVSKKSVGDLMVSLPPFSFVHVCTRARKNTLESSSSVLFLYRNVYLVFLVSYSGLYAYLELVHRHPRASLHLSCFSF